MSMEDKVVKRLLVRYSDCHSEICPEWSTCLINESLLVVGPASCVGKACRHSAHGRESGSGI